MQARATVAKTGVEGDIFSQLGMAVRGLELTDTEPPPPSGEVTRGAAVRLIAGGRLEVATTPDVVLDGVSLELSRLHSRILAALLESAGPLTTVRIAHIAWQGRFVSEHTVHSQIALLRTRMVDFGVRIRNVRGRGYILE